MVIDMLQEWKLVRIVPSRGWDDSMLMLITLLQYIVYGSLCQGTRQYIVTDYLLFLFLHFT